MNLVSFDQFQRILFEVSYNYKKAKPKVSSKVSPTRYNVSTFLERVRKAKNSNFH